MKWHQLGRLTQLARETPPLLRHPITLEMAMDQVRERLPRARTDFFMPFAA